MNKAYLQHIGYYFPNLCVTNELLSEMHPEWSAEKISKKTGIYRRYQSAEGETAADMAVYAAERMLQDSGYDRMKIDFIILCTQSPDYYLPSTSCILQDRLSLSENCGAFDYNLGCSGFVYGLGIAKGLIESQQANSVLLLTSESYTKYLHPSDKTCQTIFGDGAAASLITSKKMANGMNAEILKGSYLTIGRDFDKLIVRTGGSRFPRNGKSQNVLNEDGSFLSNDDYLYMDGKKIFDFSAEKVPEMIIKNIMNNGYSMDDVGLFILHQANMYMMNIVKMRCHIPSDKFVVELEDGGNTVSSTIPIAFKKWTDKNSLKDGMIISLCGFGVGLSIGSIALRTSY